MNSTLKTVLLWALLIGGVLMLFRMMPNGSLIGKNKVHDLSFNEYVKRFSDAETPEEDPRRAELLRRLKGENP